MCLSLAFRENREVLKRKQCTRGIHVTLYNNVATFSDWEVRGGLKRKYLNKIYDKNKKI